MPISVLQAEFDTTAPAQDSSDLLLADFPDRVEVVPITDAGHARLPEQPDQVATAVLELPSRQPRACEPGRRLLTRVGGYVSRSLRGRSGGGVVNRQQQLEERRPPGRLGVGDGGTSSVKVTFERPRPRPPSSGTEHLETLLRLAAVLGLLFVFLAGVNGLGTGFKMLGKDTLDYFFAATSNPFIGLAVGILGTTLVQSSSVTTSMIVAMVAAPDNPLPLANAVPMIMGANIGTTVTNSLASLAHMGRREEFRRAFAVATCHDFFNFCTVAVLLPLEILTGFLQWSATAASGLLVDFAGVEYESPLKVALKAAVAPAKSLAAWLFASEIAQAVVLLVLSGATIIGALALLVSVLRSVMRTRAQVYLTRAFNTNVLTAMLVGAIVTVSVQSSSITTSLLVPLAGAGILSLRQALPITLGANIGTTVTALLASLAVSGPNAGAGVTIAVLHLLFNLTGVALVYGVPGAQRVPLRAASALAETAVESRRLAVLYVLGLFYGVPAALVFVFNWVW